jgi:hypothetical protein
MADDVDWRSMYLQSVEIRKSLEGSIRDGLVREMKLKEQDIGIHPIYRSGGVTRWHARPEVTAQTDADHHGRVAQIMLYFWPNVRREMIYAALHHDCGELVAGDVPHPAKQAMPELATMLDKVEAQARADMGVTTIEMTPGERRVLKFCDRLEAYTFIAMHHPHLLSNADWIEDRAHIDDTAKKLGVQARLKDWLAR